MKKSTYIILTLLGVGLVLSAVLPWTEPLFSHATPRETIPAPDFNKPSTIVSRELDSFNCIEWLMADKSYCEEEGHRYFYYSGTENVELVIIADDTVKAPVIMTSKDLMDNLNIRVEDSVLKFEVDMHTAFARCQDCIYSIGEGSEVRLLVPQSMVNSISTFPGEHGDIKMIGCTADRFAIDGRVGLDLEDCRFGSMEINVPEEQTFYLNMEDTDIQRIYLDLGKKATFSTLFSRAGTVELLHAVCSPSASLDLGNLQLETLEYEPRDKDGRNNWNANVTLGDNPRTIRFEE